MISLNPWYVIWTHLGGLDPSDVKDLIVVFVNRFYIA
jgi:hypothetical protein